MTKAKPKKLIRKEIVKESPLKKDWNKEQPHDAENGKFRKKKFSIDNPGQVEWVKNKKK